MADNLTLAERWGLLRRGSRDLTIAEQRSAILEAHAELTRLSADVARLSAELEVARRDGERLFDAGWKMAASWAGRDDLLADMDSNTFKADRLAAIDAARESGDG